MSSIFANMYLHCAMRSGTMARPLSTTCDLVCLEVSSEVLRSPMTLVVPLISPRTRRISSSADLIPSANCFSVLQRQKPASPMVISPLMRPMTSAMSSTAGALGHSELMENNAGWSKGRRVRKENKACKVRLNNTTGTSRKSLVVCLRLRWKITPAPTAWCKKLALKLAKTGHLNKSGPNRPRSLRIYVLLKQLSGSTATRQL